jgi:hypothetical protein
MLSSPTRPIEATPSASSASVAARATWAAIGTLGLSTVALALFFGGAGATFGPINDLLLAATFVLLVPAVMAVRRDPRAPGWLGALGALALVGMAILVIGNVALVARLIPLQASFVTVSLGIVALLGWGVGVGVVALRGRILEPAVGRWIAATAIAFVLAAAGWALLPIGAWSLLGVALFVTFTGWLVSLARALGRRVPADR